MVTRGTRDGERHARRDEAASPPPPAHRGPDPHTAARVLLGGSMVEALCGAAAAILLIIALAGGAPVPLASLATILVGIALIAYGSTLAGHRRETPPGDEEVRAELGSGVSAEVLVGAVGVLLGILGLAGLAPVKLPAVAAILYGSGLLLGGGLFNSPSTPPSRVVFPEFGPLASDLLSDVLALAGLAAVILGITSVLGIRSLQLALVALLFLSVAPTLTGAAVASRTAAWRR